MTFPDWIRRFKRVRNVSYSLETFVVLCGVETKTNSSSKHCLEWRCTYRLW